MSPSLEQIKTNMHLSIAFRLTQPCSQTFMVPVQKAEVLPVVTTSWPPLGTPVHFFLPPSPCYAMLTSPLLSHASQSCSCLCLENFSSDSGKWLIGLRPVKARPSVPMSLCRTSHPYVCEHQRVGCPAAISRVGRAAVLCDSCFLWPSWPVAVLVLFPHPSPDPAASAVCSEERGGQRALTTPRRWHPGQRLLLWWRRRWRRGSGMFLKSW